MKTTIKTHDMGLVTISYDDGSVWKHGRMHRTFHCPADGGYVWQGDKQVCAGLRPTGETLTCPSRDKLADVIRREYRAMRRAEAREAARYATF